MIMRRRKVDFYNLVQFEYQKQIMNKKEIALCHVKVISKKAIANMEVQEKISIGNAEENTEQGR